MEIVEIATNLRLDEDGIWAAPDRPPIPYPEHGNEDCLAIEPDSFWFRHRDACLLEALSAFPPGGDLLDIGGGNGFTARTLERSGYPTILLEPGPAGARNARKGGLERVICATLEGAGFRSGCLRAVGLFDVLEHMEDDAAFLREIARTLVRGGRMYLTVPAHSLLWSAEDDYAVHHRRYTLRGLRSRLREAGFAVELGTYIFAALVAPILLMRSLPSRLGLRRKHDPVRNRREHRLGRGFLSRSLQRLLELELSRLRRGKGIPFGASCLVVARRE